MVHQIIMSNVPLRKRQFLAGVFLISFAVLVFQIVQTRVLSVVAWYYLAFFSISVAMLGMTVGAVWVYLYRDRFQPERLATTLSDFSLLTAVSMPASLIVQFSLITSLVPVVSTLSLHKYRLPGDLRQLARLRGNATTPLGPPDWRTC